MLNNSIIFIGLQEKRLQGVHMYLGTLHLGDHPEPTLLSTAMLQASAKGLSRDRLLTSICFCEKVYKAFSI